MNSPDAKWPFLVQVCFYAIVKVFFVDSVSLRCPNKKSAGCQVGTIEEFFLKYKTKWPP